MAIQIDLSKTALGNEAKESVLSFCSSILELTPGVGSIILYGSAARPDYRPGKSDINLLIILERIDIPVLRPILDPAALGRRHGVAPFFLTMDDLLSIADLFPAKFLSIQEHYLLLAGSDMLKDLAISREHLLVRCRQEMSNALLKLRRYYVSSGGHQLWPMMVQSIGPLLENMRSLFYLMDTPVPARAETIDTFSRTFGIDTTPLKRVRQLRDEEAHLEREEAEEAYSAFTTAVQGVLTIADSLRQRA
jgi:hypothetical protein